jgi:seryl-tRNA synthetase
LPYRILNLCTGDLGIAATKTYDIEVWFPCNNKYREVSSCSNDTDFQSRGLNIKFKNKNNDLIFAHTLNGTGVSLNRLWIAVIENYQQKDGTITIPKALQKYMNGEKIIK